MATGFSKRRRNRQFEVSHSGKPGVFHIFWILVFLPLRNDSTKCLISSVDITVKNDKFNG